MASNGSHITDLLLQSLETELRGVQIYEAAIATAINGDLRDEWEEFLLQTLGHLELMEDLCVALEIDVGTQTTGRMVVGNLGASLLESIRMARETGSPEAAQRVAAECVVLAETKDSFNWELIGDVAESWDSDDARLLMKVRRDVEAEADEHLQHTKRWLRELWLDALGMPAVLPPPAKIKKVESAISTARPEPGHARMSKTRVNRGHQARRG